MISSEVRQTLIQHAEEVTQSSYSPYSHFRVGAAVLTETNKIYTGTNVENASYGLSICAERAAIFSAVAQEGPSLRLKAIVITSFPRAHPTSPCGACRQVIAEFSEKIPVIFVNGDSYMDVSSENILPHPFVLNSCS